MSTQSQGDFAELLPLLRRLPAAFAVYKCDGTLVIESDEMRQLRAHLTKAQAASLLSLAKSQEDNLTALDLGSLGFARVLRHGVQDLRLLIVDHNSPDRHITAFANRHVLIEKARITNKFAIILCAFDRLDTVLETFGPATRDELRFAAAERLADAVPNHLIARLSENEFALLLRTEKNLGAAALGTGQDLLELMTRPFMLRDEIFTIGCSVGLAVSNAEDHDPETILRYAALALFNARRAGMNQLRIFDPTLDFYARERHEIERDLSRAIALGQFQIAYQPQFRSDDLKAASAEALIRWHHPIYGEVRPGRFIPLSEESGFIAKIGEWMVKQACMEAAKWPTKISVAINVSSVELRNPSLLTNLAQALERSGLEPERLELELTENVLLDQGTQTFAMLKALRDMGVKLVLDDFGTGFSSLSYLRSFRFDKVKIDQSFIRHMGDSVEASAVLQAVLGLCGELGIPVCAEGVETKEQLLELQARGCDFVQGYHLGYPMSADDLVKLWSS